MKINSEKNIIHTLMECNFKEGYRAVLTKMLRFCNTVDKDEEEEPPMIVEDTIFNSDIISFFVSKKMNFNGLPLRTMNETEEAEFAKYFPLQ